MNILEVKGLKKLFGKGKSKVAAVNGVDFQVKSGEFLTIMGQSGSGKSTLLNLISTIDTPSEGTILFEKQDITKLNISEANKFRRDKLGFVFQDFKLISSMTIEDNIAVPLIIQRENNFVIDKKVKEIMNYLGIVHIRKSYPHEVSGGEKQRAASARAIITNPKLVLADEPTGSLDSKSSLSLMEMLKNLNSDFGTTILLVTHDYVTASYGSRIIILKDGNIEKEFHKGDVSRGEFLTKILSEQREAKKGD